MKKAQLKNSILLLLTAAIWGFAFVAQSVGMDYVGPFTFNFIRNIIGGVFLIPCIVFLDYINKKEKRDENADDAKEVKYDKKTLIIGGLCCGFFLFVASTCQQIGIQYTTVGKAGFITALYIVIVPIMGLFLKKHCGPLLWVSVAIAVSGFYLLSVKDGFVLEKSDILLILSAILFSVHILVIDYFSPKTDGVRMSCIQFFVAGILSGIVALFCEKFVIADIFSAWLPILYAGVLSCGVAYTLQIVGQKNMNPTVASLILSLESVFSVFAGWLILNQKLSHREMIGCGLIFIGIIIAQLPSSTKSKKV